MLQNEKKISHEGVILKILKDSVFVSIVQSSACSGCHAKDMCSVSEKKEKIIEIKADENNYKIGEKVFITGSAAMGFKAVFYAFIIPLIIILGCLLGVARLTGNEIAGIFCAFGFLICYYGSLYMFRGKFKKKFTFELRKTVDSEL